MNYSTTPLANIDTLNDHTGFYFVTGFVLFFLVLCWFVSDDQDDYFASLILTIFFGIVIAISGYISWNTGKIVVYKNEPVIARMYDNSVETLAYTERVNKRDVIRYQTSAFVYYEVPEGIVSFKRGDGQVWPKTVTLYRN